MKKVWPLPASLWHKADGARCYKSKEVGAWHECDHKQVAEFGLSAGNNKARVGGGSAPTCRASIMPGLEIGIYVQRRTTEGYYGGKNQCFRKISLEAVWWADQRGET